GPRSVGADLCLGRPAFHRQFLPGFPESRYSAARQAPETPGVNETPLIRRTSSARPGYLRIIRKRRERSEMGGWGALCKRLVWLHQKLGRNLPSFADLVDHLYGERPVPIQNFRCPRPVAENFCQLGLAMTHFLDGVMKHIHRVPIGSVDRPTILFVLLNERHEKITLVSLVGASGGIPKAIDLRQRGLIVSLGVDGVDVHGTSSRTQISPLELGFPLRTGPPLEHRRDHIPDVCLGTSRRRFGSRN